MFSSFTGKFPSGRANFTQIFTLRPLLPAKAAQVCGLERILNAHVVTHLYANISYSNPGHTRGFEAAFDRKLREMGASRIEFTATGSKEYPLNSEDDGMLQSIVNLSEQNGYVQATIQSTENAKLEKIDSSEHPRKLVVPQIVNDVCSTIYNTIRGIIH